MKFTTVKIKVKYHDTESFGQSRSATARLIHLSDRNWVCRCRYEDFDFIKRHCEMLGTETLLYYPES